MSSHVHEPVYDAYYPASAHSDHYLKIKMPYAIALHCTACICSTSAMLAYTSIFLTCKGNIMVSAFFFEKTAKSLVLKTMVLLTAKFSEYM